MVGAKGSSQDFCRRSNETNSIDRGNVMTPEERKEIAAHSQAIAKILDKNTAKEELTSLGKIEIAVRDALQENVMPDVGIAWCNAR